MTFEDIDDELKEDIERLDSNDYISAYAVIETVREYMDESNRDYSRDVINEAHTMIQLFEQMQHDMDN